MTYSSDPQPITFPTVPPLHVNTATCSDEQPHDLTVDCWCGPSVVRDRYRQVVVGHTGQPRPGIRRTMS